MNHWRALFPASSSAASVGNATFRIVTSIVITMRLAHTVTSAAALRPRVNGVPSVGVISG
jgi:hypothetical protein